MFFRNVKTTSEVLGLCVVAEQQTLNVISGETTATIEFIKFLKLFEHTLAKVNKLNKNSRWFELSITIMKQFDEVLVKGLKEQQSLKLTMADIGIVATNAITAFEKAGLYKREDNNGIQE